MSFVVKRSLRNIACAQHSIAVPPALKLAPIPRGLVRFFGVDEQWRAKQGGAAPLGRSDSMNENSSQKQQSANETRKASPTDQHYENTMGSNRQSQTQGSQHQSQSDKSNQQQSPSSSAGFQSEEHRQQSMAGSSNMDKNRTDNKGNTEAEREKAAKRSPDYGGSSQVKGATSTATVAGSGASSNTMGSSSSRASNQQKPNELNDADL